MMSFYLKDPRSRVDYAIDWAAYLDGQTIVASLWSVAPAEPGGIAVEEDSFAAERTAARLTGGIDRPLLQHLEPGHPLRRHDRRALDRPARGGQVMGRISAEAPPLADRARRAEGVPQGRGRATRMRCSPGWRAARPTCARPLPAGR